MMDLWWNGASLRQIGLEHEISRQRVFVILSRVGCHGGMMRAADYGTFDSWRRAPAERVVEARAILANPRSCRLTVLQRGAIAWLATGLTTTDIARRMGRHPRGVGDFLNGGRWRIEQATHGPSREVTPDPLPEYGMLDIEDLLPPK
jgi:hypothetical protein